MLAVFVAAFLTFGCKQDPIDPTSQRLRLGDIRVALSSGSTRLSDSGFSGRIIRFGADTMVSFIGSFAGYVRIRDSVANRIVSILYTLPNNAQVKVDTTMRVICIYKEKGDKSALILKTKSDSLICMIGTLLLGDLEPVQASSGAQGFRVSIGPDLYASRNTTCGREGDFNMMFATTERIIGVAPARTGQLQSAEKLYALYNVANTQAIKNLGTCQTFPAEFAYMILRQ
jgi:hypothetical protein